MIKEIQYLWIEDIYLESESSLIISDKSSEISTEIPKEIFILK